MTHRLRARIADVPASSPAAIALFIAATLGPILMLAVTMRILAA